MLNKNFFATLVLLLSLSYTNAQHKEALNELVKAEWDFINLAKETNTRDAFWAQFIDETIVFGEGPVNAKRAYEHQQPNKSWLKWEPVFSDLATSNDFGYNTGPWEFRVNKTDEKAVAFGHFVSFWKKQADGSWKLLLDIGIDHPQPKQKAEWKSSTIDFEKVSDESENSEQLNKVEQNFIDALAFAKSPAYQKILSKEARLYRPGKEPITNNEEIIKYINAEPVITFSKVGQAFASSGDLGYFYGTAVVQLANSQTKAANYLHIWKYENNQGWNLVLDLVTYR